MTERDPIPVCWVSREDLLHCRPDLAAGITALRQDEIEYLAEKIGDALQDTYWLAMDVVLSAYFEPEDASERDRATG